MPNQGCLLVGNTGRRPACKPRIRVSARYTGPTIAKEPVMTIHSRTGTESNRLQLTYKATTKPLQASCKYNSGPFRPESTNPRIHKSPILHSCRAFHGYKSLIAIAQTPEGEAQEHTELANRPNTEGLAADSSTYKRCFGTRSSVGYIHR